MTFICIPRSGPNDLGRDPDGRIRYSVNFGVEIFGDQTSAYILGKLADRIEQNTSHAGLTLIGAGPRLTESDREVVRLVAYSGSAARLSHDGRETHNISVQVTVYGDGGQSSLTLADEINEHLTAYRSS